MCAAFINVCCVLCYVFYAIYCWTGFIVSSVNKTCSLLRKRSIKTEDIRLSDDASLFMLSSLKIPIPQYTKKLSFSPLDVHDS